MYPYINIFICIHTIYIYIYIYIYMYMYLYFTPMYICIYIVKMYIQLYTIYIHMLLSPFIHCDYPILTLFFANLTTSKRGIFVRESVFESATPLFRFGIFILWFATPGSGITMGDCLNRGCSRVSVS